MSATLIRSLTIFTLVLTSCTKIQKSQIEDVNAYRKNGVAPEAPPNPVSLALVPIDEKSIAVSWSSGGGSTVGFTLHYAKGTVAPSDCDAGTDIDLNKPRFTISGLEASTPYSVRVCSFDDKDRLSPGIVAKASTLSAVAGQLRGAQVGAVTSSAISLSWTALPAVQGYRVKSAANMVPVNCDGGEDAGAQTSWTIGQLSPATNYGVRICPVLNGVVQIATSATLSATTAQPIPSDPDSLTATALNTNQIRLNWITPTSGFVKGYRVKYLLGDSAPFDCNSGVDVGNAVTYVATGLTAGASYTFRVCSYNANMPADMSGGKTVRLGAAPSVPPVPLNFAVAARTTTSISLSWNSGGGTTKSYRIATLQGTSVQPDCASGTAIASDQAMPYLVPNLTVNTQYSFALCSANADGQLSTTARLTSTTLATEVGDGTAVPPAPVNFRVTNVAQTAISLRWENGGGTTARYFLTSAEGVSNTLNCTNGTEIPLSGPFPYVVSGLKQNTAYTFGICASTAAPNKNLSPATLLAGSTDLSTPPVPINLTVVSRAEKSISLRWDSGGGSTATYNVNYATGTSNYLSCNNRVSGFTGPFPAVFSNLLTGNTYTFAICAVSSGPQPKASDPVRIVTSTDLPHITTEAVDFKVVSTDRSNITLSWQRPSDFSGSYYLKRAKGNTFPPEYCDLQESVTSPYRITVPADGSTYSFRLCSRTTAGISRGVTTTATLISSAAPTLVPPPGPLPSPQTVQILNLGTEYRVRLNGFNLPADTTQIPLSANALVALVPVDEGSGLPSGGGVYTFPGAQQAIRSTPTSDFGYLQFPTEQVGYAASEDGTVVKTIDGGRTWQTKLSDIALTVTGMAFRDENHGYLSTLTSLLETKDGGNTWNFKAAINLRALSLLGSQIFALRVTTVTYSIYSGSTLSLVRSDDGGATWSVVRTYGNNVAYNYNYRLTMLSPTLAYVQFTNTYLSSVGWLWPIGTNPVSIDALFSVTRVSASQWVAVDGLGNFKQSLDNGENWTTVGNQAFSQLNVRQIFPGGSGVFYAVALASVTRNASVYASQDGGRTWASQAQITDESTRGMATWAFGGGQLIAAGDRGRLARRNDSGKMQLVTELPSDFTELRFFGAARDFGVAVPKSGAYPYLYVRSANRTWSSIYLPFLTPSMTVRQVFFITPNVGWMITTDSISKAIQLFATYDAGKSWNQRNGTGLAWNTYTPPSVHFIDANVGWAVTAADVKIVSPATFEGAFRVLRTQDSGNTWTLLATFPHAAVYNLARYSTYRNVLSIAPYFLDANRGFLLVERVIYRTEDGGVTWKLAAVDPGYGPEGARLERSGNRLMVRGKDRDSLHSADLGQSWRSVKGLQVNEFYSITNAIPEGMYSGHLQRSSFGAETPEILGVRDGSVYINCDGTGLCYSSNGMSIRTIQACASNGGNCLANSTFFSTPSATYYADYTGKYCVIDSPLQMWALGAVPTTVPQAAATVLSTLVNAGHCRLPAGFFTSQSAAFVANAKQQYCGIDSVEQWKNMGGPNVANDFAAIPEGMQFAGTCQMAAGFFTYQGAGFFANNAGEYCLIPDPEQWRQMGAPGNYIELARIPDSMVLKGECALPAGFFRFGDALYQGNSTGQYCQIPSVAQWNAMGGPTTYPTYAVIPKSMQLTGECLLPYGYFFLENDTTNFGYRHIYEGFYRAYRTSLEWQADGGPSDRSNLPRYPVLPTSMRMYSYDR